MSETVMAFDTAMANMRIQAVGLAIQAHQQGVVDNNEDVLDTAAQIADFINS